MQHREVQNIIDLARYPLDRLDAEAGQALVAECREKLDEQALCALPGFVRPDVVERMASQAAMLLPAARRSPRAR